VADLTRKQQDDVLKRAVKLVEESEDAHIEFMRGVDERYKAYKAIADPNSPEAQWRSQVFPPYAMHIVDSTLASMVEDRLKFNVKPRPALAMAQDPDERKLRMAGAEAHKILLEWQARQTKFTRLQRPFLLQNAIAGITVAKTFWTEKIERRRKLVSQNSPVLDDNGNPMLDRFGQAMSLPQLQQVVVPELVYDKNARSIKDARFVAHRIWLSREDLEANFKDGGPFGPDRGGWTWAKVKKTIGDVRNFADKHQDKWGETKKDLDDDKLEVLEVWDNFHNDVITVVNRTALCAYKARFPFYHEGTPFVVCTTQPDSFKVAGISQIEKVMGLQQLLWKTMNQRIDNLELVNNAIVMFRPDLEDYDALEFYPGAQWPMIDPSQVQMWAPNPLPAEVSTGAEALIKGDMQNLAATFPFSSGAESQTVDQKTATGASIVSSLAQRSIDMAKQPVYDAWEDIGQMWVALNAQFIREPIAAEVIEAGESAMVEIMPELLEGDYEYIIEPMPSAIMEQQVQAKAQAVVQIMGQMAPILLPLAQQGAARMVNFDEVIKFYLDAMGVEDTERFFISQAPQTALPGQASQPQPGQAPNQEPQAGAITGPGAIDAAVSPGAQTSMSPTTLMHGLLSQGGGVGGAA
jgi:hypothetical protein